MKANTEEIRINNIKINNKTRNYDKYAHTKQERCLSKVKNKQMDQVQKEKT